MRDAADGAHGRAEGARGSLLSAAWKIVGALGVFGALVLGVGLALPGTWRAERSVVVAASPDSVFAWLDAPARWDRWTALGTVTSEASGPARGAGATLAWDDDWVGEGSFTIVGSRPPEALAYRVEVEGGAMVTEGRFRLEPAAGEGTRVTWTESGDFGWNPLMGYAALNMGEIQGVELERALARLKALVETGSVPDSLAGAGSVPDDTATVPTPR